MRVPGRGVRPRGGPVVVDRRLRLVRHTGGVGDGVHIDGVHIVLVDLELVERADGRLGRVVGGCRRLLVDRRVRIDPVRLLGVLLRLARLSHVDGRARGVVGRMSGPAVPQVRTFRAIGTTALVAVTDGRAADGAVAMLQEGLDALDRACSRFRDDAEIARVHRAGGAPVAVGDVLLRVLSTALDVARMTAGAVDPTVGVALERLGYDRDFALVRQECDALPAAGSSPVPAAGWWSVELDPVARTVRVPAGVHLDVGSSAKALAADEAATGIAEAFGSGVLVSLGGDVAAAGPAPEGGWAVGIAPESSAPIEAVRQVVALQRGGLASSAPGVRAWGRGTTVRHHIVDPWTGECASTHWELVSVHAPTCVEANALSTAAVVWGADAVDRLAGYRYPARLVGPGGRVVALNGWPAPPLGAGTAAPPGRSTVEAALAASGGGDR